MARIGEKTIEEIADQIEGLTRAWLMNLNDAFKKFGAKKFPVNFKVTLDAGSNGTNHVSTEIKFRPEPDISDTASGSAEEDQLNLFEVKFSVAPIKDRRGPVGRAPRFKALGG